MKKLLSLFAFLFVSSILFAQLPTASYPMNGDANDVVGGRNGAVTGAALATDRFNNTNKAYSFAGGSDVIAVPNDPAFNFTDYLSASAWVYVSTTPPAADGTVAYSIVSKNEGPGNNQKKWLFGLQNGKLAFHHNGPGLASGEWVYSNNFTLTQNKWYHVAFVKEAQMVTFYINSENAGTFTLPSAMVNPSASLQIGNSENTVQFVGKLDEVNIWGNTLTQKEIQKQYYEQALVACYNFTGNTDDQSGNDNHGSSTTATLVNDRFGIANAAYFFNGTSDFIDVPNSPSIQLSNTYTLAAWVNPFDFYNGPCQANFILAKGPQNSEGHFNLQYGDFLDGSCSIFTPTNVNFASTIKRGGVDQSVYQNPSTLPVSLLNWYYVVCTNDGTTQKLFVNGALISTKNITGSFGALNSDNLFIGKSNDGSGYFVNGVIDDVKLYNVALSDAAVFDNYIKDQTLPGSGEGVRLNRTGTLSTDPGVNIGKGYDFGTEPFTYETWLKRDDLHATANNFGISLIVSELNNGWGVGIDNNNLLYFTKVGVNGSFSTGTIADTKWHHVAVVYTGSELKFYIDGMDAGTNSYTDNFTSGGNYTIGARQTFGNTNGDQTLNGKIDESRIWRNVALTESEIRDWMCKKITSSHPHYSKLFAYFNFDENIGSLAQARKSASVLNPTIRGFGGHFGELINGALLQTSGAALGDESVHDYITANKTVILGHTTGEYLTVNSTTGNPDGIHVYHVNEAPNSSTGLNQTDPFPHYFGVLQIGGTSPEYTATYSYLGQNVPTAESNLRLFSRTNNAATSWTEYPALPNTSNQTITLTGQNTEYILAGGLTTLPLNLLSFTGKNENDQNILNWLTANEVALSHFEIERSPLTPGGGISNPQFEKIGEVKANGGPSEKVSYEFIAPLAPDGGAFYRLKMVDLDGSFKYSKKIFIQTETPPSGAGGLIYPNPTSEYFSISGNSVFEKLQIVDAAGRLVKEFLPHSDNKYSLMGLAPGVYVLKKIGGNVLTNNKLVIK